MNRVIFLGISDMLDAFITIPEIGVVKSTFVKTLKESPLLALLENAADIDLPIASKYPVLSPKGKEVRKNAESVYVLGTCGASVYIVMTANISPVSSMYRVIPRGRFLRDITAGSIYPLNAVVEEIDGVSEIRPISGEWVDASAIRAAHLKDAVSTGQIDAKFFDYSASSALSVHAEAHLDMQDEYAVLTQTQRDVLQTYYLWYSAEMADEITDKARFITAKKAEKLAALKVTGKDGQWRFAGFYDVWRKGAEKCELGHPLRYVWLACPAEMTLKDAKAQGCAIKFGRQCVGDFLQISDAVIKKIWRAQQEMVDEIEFVVDVLLNGKVAAHNSYNESFIRVFNELKSRGSAEKVLGERISASISAFIGAGLPLVESLVLSAVKKLKDYAASYDSSDESGIHALCREIGLNTAFLPRILDGNAAKTLTYSLDESPRKYVTSSSSAGELLLMSLALFIGNDIAGEYRYDPCCDVTDYRRLGCKDYARRNVPPVKFAYSKEAKTERSHLMACFERYGISIDKAANYKGSASALTYDGIKNRLAAFNGVLDIYSQLKATLGADFGEICHSVKAKLQGAEKDSLDSRDTSLFEAYVNSLGDFGRLWCAACAFQAENNYAYGVSRHLLYRTVGLGRNSITLISELLSRFNNNHSISEFADVMREWGKVTAVANEEPTSDETPETDSPPANETGPTLSVAPPKPQNQPPSSSAKTRAPVRPATQTKVVAFNLKAYSDSDLAASAEKILETPFAATYTYRSTCEGILASYKRNPSKPLSYKQRWPLGQFIAQGGLS